MIRAVADTNIIVSAVVYGRGKPREILHRALIGEINLTASQPILDEMADVFSRKFDLTPDEITEALAIVKRAARTIKPAVQLDVIKEDPPDNRILECAVSAGSDYIITGDKDLLRLKQYDAVRIVSVADFLEFLGPRTPI